MKLSKHLTLAEAIKSNTAIRKKIDNTPTPEHLENLKLVAEKIFEPIREYFNVPIGVSSMYRSFDLNKSVKGSKTSQHCKGEAIDIDADIYGGVTNSEIFNYVLGHLHFDQLIWEFGDEENPAWVHISYKKENNRKQVLTIK
jgi:uncharacterized protein YcbK (DUF882 family)